MAEEMQTILEFSEDISEAEAPLPLPAGEYEASIQSAAVRVSQNGNPYIQIGLLINPDQYPVDYPVEEAPEGTILYYNRTPAADDKRARYRIRKLCESIGAPVPSKHLDLNEWIGLTARVQVDVGEWEGMPRSEASKILGND